jgi:hypothetical protein
MNKHILFVMDHLANPDKYTQEEVLANFEDIPNYYASATYSADAAARAARAAHAYYAANNRFAHATYWVDEYFKYAGENKQAYIDALGE